MEWLSPLISDNSVIVFLIFFGFKFEHDDLLFVNMAQYDL